MSDTAWKILINVIAGLAILGTVALDYFYHDKRTKKFKNLRISLIVIVLLSILGNSFLIYSDDNKSKKNRTQDQNTIKDLRDSLSAVKYTVVETGTATSNKVVETSERLTRELEEKAKVTAFALGRLYATTVSAEKQIKQQVGEVQKLKYGISDNFTLNFKIQFKNAKLSKQAREIIKTTKDYDVPFLFIINSPVEPYQFPPAYDSLKLSLFNKYENCAININIGNYPHRFMLNKRTNINTALLPNTNEDKADMPYLNFRAFFFYDMETDIFSLNFENFPIRILLQDGDVASIDDLKDSEIKVSLDFYYGKGKEVVSVKQEFEIDFIGIMMNNVAYIGLSDFEKVKKEYTPNTIRFYPKM